MLKKIRWFIQGNRRKALIGTWFEFFLPRHIVEQYNWRLTKADERCIKRKSCLACGCTMPAVALADKGCRANCYPAMMSKKVWKEFKTKNNL